MGFDRDFIYHRRHRSSGRASALKIKVKSFPRGEVDKSIEFPDKSTALDLFKALNMRPDNWIVARDDKVIPDDAPLNDGDSIRLLSVVSGG